MLTFLAIYDYNSKYIYFYVLSMPCDWSRDPIGRLIIDYLGVR